MTLVAVPPKCERILTHSIVLMHLNPLKLDAKETAGCYIPACIASGIPACLAAGSGGSAPGGSAPGGCLLWGMPALGGACSGGFLLWGQCLLWGGLLPGGSAALGGGGGCGYPPTQKQTATVADGTHPTGMHSSFH